MKIQRWLECWASILTSTFGTTRTAELIASRVGRNLSPKNIPWYSFLLEAEWTPRLLNADKRMSTLENFQGTYRESKSEPPVLWRSACNQLRHLFNPNTLIVKLFVIFSLARHLSRYLSHANCSSARNLVFVFHSISTEQ